MLAGYHRSNSSHRFYIVLIFSDLTSVVLITFGYVSQGTDIKSESNRTMSIFPDSEVNSGSIVLVVPLDEQSNVFPECHVCLLVNRMIFYARN